MISFQLRDIFMANMNQTRKDLADKCISFSFCFFYTWFSHTIIFFALFGSILLDYALVCYTLLFCLAVFSFHTVIYVHSTKFLVPTLYFHITNQIKGNAIKKLKARKGVILFYFLVVFMTTAIIMLLILSRESTFSSHCNITFSFNKTKQHYQH